MFTRYAPTVEMAAARSVEEAQLPGQQKLARNALMHVPARLGLTVQLEALAADADALAENGHLTSNFRYLAHRVSWYHNRIVDGERVKHDEKRESTMRG